MQINANKLYANFQEGNPIREFPERGFPCHCMFMCKQLSRLVRLEWQAALSILTINSLYLVWMIMMWLALFDVWLTVITCYYQIHSEDCKSYNKGRQHKVYYILIIPSMFFWNNPLNANWKFIYTKKFKLIYLCYLSPVLIMVNWTFSDYPQSTSDDERHNPPLSTRCCLSAGKLWNW